MVLSVYSAEEGDDIGCPSWVWRIELDECFQVYHQIFWASKRQDVADAEISSGEQLFFLLIEGDAILYLGFHPDQEFVHQLIADCSIGTPVLTHPLSTPGHESLKPQGATRLD